jgi:hypothetical protein
MSVNLFAIWAYEMEKIKQQRRQDADRKNNEEGEQIKKAIMKEKENEQACKDFDDFFKEPKDMSLNGLYDTYIAPKREVTTQSKISQEINDSLNKIYNTPYTPPKVKIPSDKEKEKILDGLDSLIDSLFDKKLQPKQSKSHCITGSYNMSFLYPKNYACSASYVTSPKPVKSMTLNQLFDQMYQSPNTTPNPKKPSELDALQDQLEEISMRLNDANDTVVESKTEILSLNKQIANLTLALDREQAMNISREQTNGKCLKLEHDIVDVKNELKVCEQNRKYAMDYVEQQASLLNEAKRVINELRARVMEGSIDKTNAEHLAKKAIQLQEENTRLSQEANGKKSFELSYNAVSTELANRKEFINELTEDMDKYRKQVARLLQEKMSYDCQANGTGAKGTQCGNCLSCQLQQTKAILAQTTENFEKANAEKNHLKNQLDCVDTQELNQIYTDIEQLKKQITFLYQERNR